MTFTEILNERINDSGLKHASQLKFDKNGIGETFFINGKTVTVIVDKELPTNFILSKISTTLEKAEKDILDRLD